MKSWKQEEDGLLAPGENVWVQLAPPCGDVTSSDGRVQFRAPTNSDDLLVLKKVDDPAERTQKIHFINMSYITDVESRTFVQDGTNDANKEIKVSMSVVGENLRKAKIDREKLLNQPAEFRSLVNHFASVGYNASYVKYCDDAKGPYLIFNEQIRINRPLSAENCDVLVEGSNADANLTRVQNILQKFLSAN